MRLIFAGTPGTAVPSLDALLQAGHEVVAVVTRPDARAGRGRTLMPSAVRQRAAELGLPVLTPASAKDPQFRLEVERLAPQAAAVVAYGALLPRDLLAVPEHGWINLHFSLLPAWRGAAPVQHAIIAGDEMTGATTFRIVEALDAGPVFGRMTEPIRPRDTAGELLERLATAGAGLLVATVDGLAAGDLVAVPQDGAEVSLAPRLQVADARIRWHHPAIAVDRLVRGCTPAPGAWTTFRGERLGLGPLTPVPAGPELAPGQLAPTRQEVLVGTATTPVSLGQVRPAGRRPMAAADWARGARPEAGELFGAD